MATELFRAEQGFSDTKVHYLSGIGAPDAAEPIGSSYLDTTNGDMYTKISAGSGLNAWSLRASKSYVDNLVEGISWMEPVIVADMVTTDIADLLALMNDTSGTPDVVDGVVIGAGARILLGGLTVAPGVYDATGGTANWVLTPDANNPTTKGDTVFVQDGINVTNRYTYNGTTWVLSDKSTRDELDAIRVFVGKNGVGVEPTAYTSTNVVTAEIDLESAIGQLDAEIGAGVAGANRTIGTVSDQAINANIAALDVAIGANVTGSIFVGVGNNVNVNLSLLDGAIGVPVVTDSIVNNGGTCNDNIKALSNAILSNIVRTEVLNVTAATVIDSTSCQLYSTVKYLLEIRLKSALETKVVMEILATHNGTMNYDATAGFFTEYAKLETNGEIPGLVISVAPDAGVGAAQVLELKVHATPTIDVRVMRLVVKKLT